MSKLIKYALVLMVILIVATGCDDMLPSETGSLILHIHSDLNVKTLEPTVVMEIAKYNIYGDGPGQETFEAIGVTDTTHPENDLRIGVWTVTVEGINAEDIKIAEETKAISIYKDQTTTADITVVPMVGTGIFNFTLERMFLLRSVVQ